MVQASPAIQNQAFFIDRIAAVHCQTKTAIWVLAAGGVLVGLLGAGINFRRGIVSAYYEWGTTCMIASYAEEHGGVPPSKWEDLIGYEYHSKYLPDPRTIAAASQHISVDFGALQAFHAGTISELPQDVITPLQGLEVHWINPKTELERYFRDGERPHGSFDREQAELLRSDAES